MEGIVDGCAVDDCFWCALLYPEQDECPRCSKRMRYVAASLMDDVTLAAVLEQQLVAYQTARAQADHADDNRQERIERLTTLLEHLHRYAPAALAILDDLGGPPLARLRHHWESLTSATTG